MGAIENKRYAVPGSPLTKREEQVLPLMALGWENTEIANELGLGTNTVKTFVSRILYRLRARNRTEAVANAYRQGLLPIDTEEKEN